MEKDDAVAICLQTKLQESLKIIRKYDWLLNAYVLDFYVEDHWMKLPPSWQEFLETLPPENLSELLNNEENNKMKTLWPLSLLALRELIKNLCIARKPKVEPILPSSNITEHPKLKHIFSKGVKQKKRHEIQRMAAVCKQSCMQTSVDFIVDFGAGLGHLARVLSYGHGISVCCLEMQNGLNTQANLIDLQLERTASRHLSSIEITHFKRPTHVTLCLTADMQAQDFLNTIRKSLQLPNNDFTFGIIGLHPCGDLGAILMRMFLNCEQAKFLNFVGCCYMKLSTAADSTNPSGHCGYPLSRFLQMQPSQIAQLSYEAREISCHAIEIYCDRLAAGNYEYLKVHSFRAAGERIIVKHWPTLKHCGLRSVKHTEGMQFEDYFYKAVHGLTPTVLSLAELHNSVTISDLVHWKRIVIFYTLRLMLAPLVENVILNDRILYLMENDCHVEINAIFDPYLSPRNHITSATKRS